MPHQFQMKYTIKPLTSLDSRSVRDIFHEVFHEEDWSELNWIWRYRSKSESVGVFNSTGDLLGFALILQYSRKLKYLGVHPLYQNFGLGSMLLRHTLKVCNLARSSLALVPANQIVSAWYYRHGFRISKYFRAIDNTWWSIMYYHTRNTRSKGRPLLGGL